ncbi:M1 family metallopeptidase [Microlunatus soli]|uniref:Peptidase family M1 n=1 Tax=Microlunatus soli TaxID=630515 RepID=A0A1H1YTB0_9ACTN|nr:M1 family metallopeptidase [Microlunatus soli]SDT24684.1 Peptidase family M1 [Microlunatus soli]
MIIATVLIMIAGLVVAPLIPDSLISRITSPNRSDPTAPVDPGGRYDGSSGVGDPYYPDYGNGGYDAQRYTVSLEWIPKSQTLTGSAVITARSTKMLRSFYVDLMLPVNSVTVDDEEADFERSNATDVKITPKDPIADNAAFEVMITYGGRPAEHKIDKDTPWWVTGDEVTAAGEPEGAAWWYPGNDHPADPASFDVSVRVPAGMEVISNGRLVSSDADNDQDFATWHWVCDQTMSSYQALLSIGQYELRQGTTDGRRYVYAVSDQLPADDRKRAFANLATSAQIIRDLEAMWGRYPYQQFGGVVPAHQLWFAGLETATRPVYDARSIIQGDGADLITHELAHMWFGGKVTLEQWNDIFNSEAYASFSEWLRTERTGGPSADDALHSTYDRVKDNQDFWEVTMTDPGKQHLFDAVYYRGPMTLQALRNVMGDDAFFRFSRDWARGGTESVEDWMAAAQTYTGVDLDPFFAAWMSGRTAPAETAENGLA